MPPAKFFELSLCLGSTILTRHIPRQGKRWWWHKLNPTPGKKIQPNIADPSRGRNCAGTSFPKLAQRVSVTFAPCSHPGAFAPPLGRVGGSAGQSTVSIACQPHHIQHLAPVAKKTSGMNARSRAGNELRYELREVGCIVAVHWLHMKFSLLTMKFSLLTLPLA